MAPHSTAEQAVGWNEIIEEPVLLDDRIKFTRIDEHEFDGPTARQLALWATKFKKLI